MTDAAATTKFFSLIDAKTKADILANIAGHYQITPTEAEAAVLDDEAWGLLDYLTEPTRTSTYVLMQRHGLA